MSLLKEKIEIGIEETEFQTQKFLGSINPFFRWLLIISTLAIIPAYFVAKSVSQKIWTARYQQGALVAKPSFTDPKAPKISTVTLTSLGDNLYSAVVQITNENLDLSANNAPFSLNFYNSQKQLLYSYQDKLFLLPDQKKYIIAPRFEVYDKIAFAELTFSQEIKWQKRLNLPQAKLTASQPISSYQISPQAFVLDGNFINNSVYTLKQVRLNFVLFDTDGKIIGASRRDEFTVAPFERRSYKQLWPNLSAPTLGKVEVTVETNTLDDNNLSVPKTSTTPASDLSRPK
ncbi:MAG: hypothetical protein WC794_00685 [Candidatus Doudnabacteria bacterium]|jgi:hypothetical protein